MLFVGSSWSKEALFLPSFAPKSQPLYAEAIDDPKTPYYTSAGANASVILYLQREIFDHSNDVFFSFCGILARSNTSEIPLT